MRTSSTATVPSIGSGIVVVSSTIVPRKPPMSRVIGMGTPPSTDAESDPELSAVMTLTQLRTVRFPHPDAISAAQTTLPSTRIRVFMRNPSRLPGLLHDAKLKGKKKKMEFSISGEADRMQQKLADHGPQRREFG